MSDIEDRVKCIVSEELHVEVDHIHNNDRFVEDLGADQESLDAMFHGFEREFEIIIREDDRDRLCTVQEAIDYITDLQN